MNYKMASISDRLGITSDGVPEHSSRQMADEESNNQNRSFLLTGICPNKDKIN